jgi:hypothetical protein
MSAAVEPEACVSWQQRFDQGGQNQAGAHCIPEDCQEENHNPEDAFGGQLERGAEQLQRRDTAAGLADEQPVAILGGQFIGRSQPGKNSLNGGAGFLGGVTDVGGDFAHDLFALADGERAKMQAESG